MNTLIIKFENKHKILSKIRKVSHWLLSMRADLSPFRWRNFSMVPKHAWNSYELRDRRMSHSYEQWTGTNVQNCTSKHFLRPFVFMHRWLGKICGQRNFFSAKAANRLGAKHGQCLHYAMVRRPSYTFNEKLCGLVSKQQPIWSFATPVCHCACVNGHFSITHHARIPRELRNHRKVHSERWQTGESLHDRTKLHFWLPCVFMHRWFGKSCAQTNASRSNLLDTSLDTKCRNWLHHDMVRRTCIMGTEKQCVLGSKQQPIRSFAT